MSITSASKVDPQKKNNGHLNISVRRVVRLADVLSLHERRCQARFLTPAVNTLYC